MFGIKLSLFSQTKSLENKVNNFHDKIIDSAAIFRKAIKAFLIEDNRIECQTINRRIKKVEHEADSLRRDIENQLYTQNLLPNLQADILYLVESLDKIINRIDEVIYKFYIEQPEIPAKFHKDLIEICHQAADCAEYMAIASRAFFKDLSTVRDYSHKVYLMEQESDITYNNLKKAIFGSDLPLANKLQLDLLVTHVAGIADTAEDCADKLSIFILKRDV